MPDKPLTELVGDMLLLEAGDWDFDYYRGDGPYDSFVEREVRKRIEARGWVWVVQKSTGDGYVACVGEEEISYTDLGKCADTPAEALLCAYLQALEANAS